MQRSRSGRPRRRDHAGAVLVGGAVGSLGRGLLSEAMPVTTWPWATLIANVAGTALLVWLVVRRPAFMAPAGLWRSLLGVGFCGALTTFSLFQVELVDLMNDGHAVMAAGYVAASLAAGLAVAFGIRGSERNR